MKTANRPGLLGVVIMLGVALALAAVVITSNTPVHANSAPDLEVGTPSVDDATLYTSNSFTLSVTVTNAGDGASEATTLRYYRSIDSTITSSDTAQGSDSVGALATAGTSDHDGGMTAPSEAGTYYYGACVDSVTDESDTTDNCSSSVTVTVSEPAPDLAVLGIDYSDGVETGESFRIGVTVQNLGDGQSAATTLRWLQVTTGASDTELGTDAIRALNLHQANFETIRLTAPSTPGTYTYKACVDSVAGESDTTNNCRSVAITLTNNLATGAPTISGTAQVGQTLTASTSDIADTDGLTNVSYSYQWLADDTEIDGATSSTYTVQSTDTDKVIKVRVTFTDDVGNEESLTSAATAAVAARSNSQATGAPTIRGTARVAETLTASTSDIADSDGLTNATFSYQWVRNDGTTDTDIQDATGSTYTLASGDKGKTVEVQVSFTDDADNEESLTSEATAAVAAAPTPLTASIHNAPERHDGENSFTFELRFSETPRDGFSFKTLRDHAFTVTGGDVVKARRLEPGKNIRWEITVTPSSSADVTITLPATTDCDNQGAICTGDGRKLSGRVEVSVSAPNNVATGAPTISGTVQVDETLTAGTSGIADEDGLTNVSYSYQWLADGEELSGSTGSTYTLVSDDEGKAISVAVSFTDDAGNDESLTSAATDAVEAKPNTPATGQPAISGTAQVGETLTAGTSGIADEDGLENATYSYQWVAGDTDISGATAATYTLAEADKGKAISVTVSFTDDAGNDESLTSAATDAVAAKANTPATGAPTISGTVQVGETLTANTSAIADEDGLENAEFGYQWLAGDSNISGATGSTYALADSEEDKAITVTVSFTDDAGNDETLTSDATDAVAGLPPEPLTASIENAATSHDGTAFTFELRFSEELGLSYKTLRDRAFTVTGGDVKKAKRLEQGSNIGWRITVKPNGNGDVTIVLPETSDCDAQGAICTEDGRKLSNRLELTVSGTGS